MNQSHLWKFMLCVVTFWLGFAVASPAQQCLQSCTVGSMSVTVTVNQASISGMNVTTVSVDPICVAPTGTITWNLPQGSSVQFQGTVPLTWNTNATSGTAQASVSGGATPGTCWEYTAQYCSSPGNCAAILDPQVVIACPPPGTGGTSCPPGSKAHKKSRVL